MKKFFFILILSVLFTSCFNKIGDRGRVVAVAELEPGQYELTVEQLELSGALINVRTNTLYQVGEEIKLVPVRADNNPGQESFNKRLKLEKEEWLDRASK